MADAIRHRKVTKHIDGWISLYDQYGQELDGAHRMTRNMFLNILPVEMKSKITAEPKLAGKCFRELAAWCRNHVLQEQHEALAEVTRKALGKELSGKVNALSPGEVREEELQDVPPPPTPDPDAPPRWARPLIMALNGNQAARNHRKDEPRGRKPTRTPSPGANRRRGTSPSPGRRLIDWGKMFPVRKRETQP